MNTSRIILVAAGLTFAVPAWAQPVQTCTGSGSICGTEYPEDPSGSFTIIDGLKTPGIAVTPTGPTAGTTPGTYAEPANSNNIDAAVYGADGVAVGNGARVGKFVPQVGTGPSCDSGYHLVNNDTTCKKNGFGSQPIDATKFNAASADFVPAHTIPTNKGTAIGSGAVVEHNGSTAVGADAKSTRANQVVLGTEKTSITAPGIHNGNQFQDPGSLEMVTTDKNGNLGTDGGATNRAITANTALLSQHSATLEEHARGIAIAMALPDAWIESNKRFAIAGSVGGFGDETALGAAAILRLDDVWSVNGKLGSDTSFEEFGWQVGARASW